jgi:ATP-dependent Clp protease ATP-binding subunit ClpC
MFSNLSDRALAAMAVASAESQNLKHYYVGVEHMFIGLCSVEDTAIAGAMQSCALDATQWRRKVRASLEPGGEPPWGRRIIITPRADRITKIAGRIQRHHGAERIDPAHLMLALLVENDSLPIRVMAGQGVDVEAFRRAMAKAVEDGAAMAKFNPRASLTPALAKFGRDLTFEAERGRLSPLIGRREELKRIAQILVRRTKNNPLIVGEAGVGKSCLVYGLAQYLASAEAVDILKGKRIFEVSMSSVLAGTKYRGEFEERLQKIVEEAQANPDIILFLDEVHTVVGAGAAQGAMDAANILKPQLANGQIRCIGATTLGEYWRHIQPDAALERRFEVVQIPEPSQQETVEILRGLRSSLEAHHRVEIRDEAIVLAAKLAARYLTDRSFPDKAIDLVDTACAQTVLSTIHRTPGGPERPVVEKAAVAQVVAQKLDEPIPEGGLTEEDAEKALRLEQRLAQRVLGQSEAVSAVARVMRAQMAGLSDPRRPIAVFLFVGPTGVGKTELARALAMTWFGGENKLLRFDMSEYGEAHTVSRLLGAPPGYVGHDAEGQLMKAVRTRPYSVVLLDEIEKAHPDILKVFLQVFDAGRLTDAKGRVVHFSNTVIIMTSNIGSAIRESRPLGFGGAEDRERGWEPRATEVKNEIRKQLPPEFRNRLSAEIIFRPLTDPNHLRGILELLLNQVREYLRERELQLTIDDEAMNILLKTGYSKEFGARELGRTVDRLIRDRLAELLLRGEFRPGNTIRVTGDPEGRLDFNSGGGNHGHAIG